MDKLTISVHSSFLPEKKYILGIMFNEFLGLDFDLKISKKKNIHWQIQIKGKGKLVFEDWFFSQNNEDIGYIHKEALPHKFDELTSMRTPEGTIPVIYGNKLFSMSKTGPIMDAKTGVDVFASAFYLLTRWEELVIDEYDELGRFDENHSFLVKNNYHKRPIVNEYVEYIWNLLIYIGFEGERGKKTYKVIPTHDIDFLRRYDTKKKMLRTIFGNFKKKRRRYFFSDIKDIYRVLKDSSKDPFLNFDFLMSVSERVGLKSIFYVIPSIEDESESTYSIEEKDINDVISLIKRRNHHIGMHSSRSTFKDPEAFHKEYIRLKEKCSEIYSVRQHYLQFSVPITWQMIDHHGIKMSSNMAYSAMCGFKSGCCYDYPIFNVLTREQLELREWPLIMMESALLKDAPDRTKFFEEAVGLAFKVRNYGGNFVFLWHNSNFKQAEWVPISKMYNWFVGEVAKQK